MSDISIKSRFASWILVFALAGAGLFFTAPTLLAKTPVYDRGELLSMDSQSCGSKENGGKTVAGEILGTDSEKQTTEQVLCQDYVLQSDRIVYHIRPKDEKHAVLLPVGNAVEFRLTKTSLFLRDPESGEKEREYVVVSMRPRTDVSSARAASPTAAATDGSAEQKP